MNLEVDIMPIGQGAFQIVWARDDEGDLIYLAIVDCGSDSHDRIKEYLIEQSIKYAHRLMKERGDVAKLRGLTSADYYIDHIIISHMHTDHYNKFVSLLDGLKASADIVKDTPGGTKKRAQNFMKGQIPRSGSPFVESADNDEFEELHEYDYEFIIIEEEYEDISLGYKFFAAKEAEMREFGPFEENDGIAEASFVSTVRYFAGNHAQTETKLEISSSCFKCKVGITRDTNVGVRVFFDISFTSELHTFPLRYGATGSGGLAFDYVCILAFARYGRAFYPAIFDSFENLRKGDIPIEYGDRDLMEWLYELLVEVGENLVQMALNENARLQLGLHDQIMLDAQRFAHCIQWAALQGMTAFWQADEPDVDTIRSILEVESLEGAGLADGNTLHVGSIYAGGNVSLGIKATRAKGRLDVFCSAGFAYPTSGTTNINTDEQPIYITYPYGTFSYSEGENLLYNDSAKDQNDRSLITIYCAPDLLWKFVLPGDATDHSMYCLLHEMQSGENFRAEVIDAGANHVAPHHGAIDTCKADVLRKYLAATKTTCVVISADAGSRYGHPTATFTEIAKCQVGDSSVYQFKHHISVNTNDCSVKGGAVFTFDDIKKNVYTCFRRDGYNRFRMHDAFNVTKTHVDHINPVPFPEFCNAADSSVPQTVFDFIFE